MSVKIGLTRQEIVEGGWSQRTVMVGGEVDEAGEAINFLVFKDTTDGKKYKIQVTNGVVEVIEVA